MAIDRFKAFRVVAVAVVCALSALMILSGYGVRTASAASASNGVLISRPGAYDYAASVIRDATVRHYWWCADAVSPITGRRTDTIMYRRYDTTTGVWSAMRVVFAPSGTAGAWDSMYTCDPTVIRGRFAHPDTGTTYPYAMYYTATDRVDGTNNRIGVAYSNDGITWVRYSRPVVSPQTSPTAGYGTGQAASVSSDGAAGVMLFHIDTR